MFNNIRNSILKIKKSVFKDGRFYLQDKILHEKTNFKIGKGYRYIIENTKKLITIIPDQASEKVVSKRMKNGEVDKAVIDIRNKEMKEVLQEYATVTVVICKDRIIVIGYDAATKKIDRKIDNEITAMTFCAGGGISAYFSEKAGFKEQALLEYNPCDGNGQWDKYAKVAEVNHPNAVMYNIPIEEFSVSMLPEKTFDLWSLTLPCNDYSTLKNNRKIEKKEDGNSSIHLFLHFVRIFSQIPDINKPKCIFFENVPQFEKVAGISLELFLKDMGYYTSSAVIDGADYGSRMHRKRWYMVANIYEKFIFPEPTGTVQGPFTQEEWFSIDDIEWCSPETSLSIKRFVERSKKNKNAMNIKAIDPTADSVSYTIPKNYRISVPQGMVRHPEQEDTYGIFPIKHLERLFNIGKDYYIGKTKTLQHEVLGQSVDGIFILKLYKGLYNFLLNFKKSESEQLALF